MPLYLMIADKPILIESPEKTIDTLKTIPTIKVSSFDEKSIPLEMIVTCDTGEGYYRTRDSQYQLTASTGTSSCLQAYLYVSGYESCLLHFNADFSMDWSRVFNLFLYKKMQLILIGASDHPVTSVKSRANILSFFSSLLMYLGSHPEISITVVSQQTLADNIAPPSPTKAIAKLPNPGFDLFGNVYDLTSVRHRLKDLPLALDTRIVRKHATEIGAWLVRTQKKTIPKTNMLIMSPGMTLADVQNQTLFHSEVVKWAESLKRLRQVEAYCNFVVVGLYGNPSLAAAIEYRKELKLFFDNVTKPVVEDKEEAKEETKVESAPFSLVKIDAESVTITYPPSCDSYVRRLQIMVDLNNNVDGEEEKKSSLSVIQRNATGTQVTFPKYWLNAVAQYNPLFLAELARGLGIAPSSLGYMPNYTASTSASGALLSSSVALIFSKGPQKDDEIKQSIMSRFS